MTSSWPCLRLRCIAVLNVFNHCHQWTSSSLSSNIVWWRHQMEPYSALLVLCAGNSPVSCEFPSQRPVMRSFDVFFDLRLNKRLSKQSRGWWFETLSSPLWHHCNVITSRDKLFVGNLKICLHVLSFLHTDMTQVLGTCNWNPFSSRTKTCLFYMVNIMGVDVLATQGARASATMIFSMLNRNNSVSAH